MPNLTGKSIVVTGAASGIGAAVARRLADEGVTVVIADLQDAAGEHLAGEIGARYEHHDVSQWDSWVRLITGVEAAAGRLDGLVNCAGVLSRAPMMATDEQLYRRIIDTNQVGVFFGMRAAAPLLTRSGGGSIVNFSSLAGMHGMPTHFAYVASKWAVRGMSKAAALELGPQGIRVNSVHPGFIDTPMTADSVPPGGRPGAGVPLGRNGRPDDVASLVLFLLSDESSYCTGGEFSVDGGRGAAA